LGMESAGQVADWLHVSALIRQMRAVMPIHTRPLDVLRAGSLTRLCHPIQADRTNTMAKVQYRES
jgi:hypothetical protein